MAPDPLLSIGARRRRGATMARPAHAPLPVSKETHVSAPQVTVHSNGNGNGNGTPHHPNPVYENSPTFQMACRQLQRVAEAVEIDPGILERLAHPKRAIVVSIP